MHSLANALFLAVATLLIPQARAASADPIAVKVVQQQFLNAKIVPDVIPAFNPLGLLQLNFGSSVGTTTVGQAISQADVHTQPLATAVGTFNGTSTKYTILMIDGNYVGSQNPDGLNMHWCQNNVALADDGTLTNTTAATIAYAGPGPRGGTGAHRYTVLLFAQPADFAAPAVPKAGTSVQLIDLATYVAAAKLSAPLAGTYFTVEVGTATVKVDPTTAVDPKSFSNGAPTSTGKPSGVPTSASPASPTPSHNGAGRLVTAAGTMLGVFGVAITLLA